ncbi:MAG: hypothetical protein LBN74_02050 [Prevotella sp.]|jgi:hypothetical protein|nr:hypothetical protein [Prevotella sp.]
MMTMGIKMACKKSQQFKEFLRNHLNRLEEFDDDTVTDEEIEEYEDAFIASCMKFRSKWRRVYAVRYVVDEDDRMIEKYRVHNNIYHTFEEAQRCTRELNRYHSNVALDSDGDIDWLKFSENGMDYKDMRYYEVREMRLREYEGIQCELFK